MRQERLRLSSSQPLKSTTTPGKVGETSSREVSAGSKKRKADDGDDDSRKRTRPVVGLPGDFFDDKPAVEETKPPVERENSITRPLRDSVHADGAAPTLASVKTLTNPTTQPPTAPIDEEEWAAFERDVASPPPDPSVPSALTAAATITAAPLTAAELAAQAREQASLQGRERREAEVEGEKEDAARALEDEFDEMEGLEERVKRLREKREELRLTRAKEAENVLEDDEEKDTEGNGAERSEEDEESDDGEDDGWGAWGR